MIKSQGGIFGRNPTFSTLKSSSAIFGTVDPNIWDAGYANNGLAINSFGGFSVARQDFAAGLFRRNGSDGSVIEFKKDNSFAGSISVSAGSTSYNTSSDTRLKKDVSDAGDVGNIIDGINVVSFKWADGSGDVSHGVIAQDLNNVFPMAVTAGDNEVEIVTPWGVDYSKLVPVLIKEIQSLRKRINVLEGSN
jgi:hypothetical protein